MARNIVHIKKGIGLGIIDLVQDLHFDSIENADLNGIKAGAIENGLGCGIFGANMEVRANNFGPVTYVIDIVQGRVVEP